MIELPIHTVIMFGIAIILTQVANILILAWLIKHGIYPPSSNLENNV